MGKLTIQEIAKTLVEKSGLSQRDANHFSTEMFAIIQQHLGQDELVKVKGLGTFKIIQVEARESVSVRTGERVTIEGHEKVSFTPDSVMKELVNRPFSQFETVVINDGVKFDDLTDDVTEEELSQTEELPSAVSVLEFADSEPEPESPVVTEEVVQTPEMTEAPAITEAPVITETPETGDEPEMEEEPEEDFEDEPEEKHSRWKVALIVVAVLGLMALSAYGGYFYAMQKVFPELILEIMEKEEAPSVSLPAPVDSVAEPAIDSIPGKPAESAPAEAEKKSSEDEKNPAEAEKKPAEAEKKAVETEDPYAAKDERVRLGAYRIIGTEKEVKVEPGQTFYSICRAHLGPDMECYVEVYNDLPRNPQIKAGQTLKIPKLEWKKKRKR